jgi:hypothetical protein
LAFSLPLFLADSIPVHQFFPLSPPRLIVGVDIVRLIEALGVFGAIEARLSPAWVDIVTKRMESDGDASAEVFCNATDLWTFVQSNGCGHRYRCGNDAN